MAYRICFDAWCQPGVPCQRRRPPMVGL